MEDIRHAFTQIYDRTSALSGNGAAQGKPDPRHSERASAFAESERTGCTVSAADKAAAALQTARSGLRRSAAGRQRDFNRSDGRSAHANSAAAENEFSAKSGSLSCGRYSGLVADRQLYRRLYRTARSLLHDTPSGRVLRGRTLARSELVRHHAGQPQRHAVGQPDRTFQAGTAQEPAERKSAEKSAYSVCIQPHRTGFNETRSLSGALQAGILIRLRNYSDRICADA